MNTKIICFIVPLLFLYQLSPGQDRDARQKIETARIGLITERLGLTPEQAEKFWPIYNEYNNQRKNLVQELQEARRNVDMQNISEEQGQALMKLGLDIKERQLQLEKNYSQRLMQVISTQQMLSLRKAEDDFRKMIIQRLEERKRQQIQQEQMINRREELMKNRGNN
jgi:hypothetical protein